MPSLKQSLTKLLAGATRQHEPDKTMMVAIGIVVVFGLVMLSSASSAIAYVTKGQDIYYFFKNQLVGIGMGLAAMWFFYRVDYHLWRRYGFLFLVVSIALLLLVFIPGLSATWGKSRSWINIFGFSLQPSELVKISFLIYLASWLEKRGETVKDLVEGALPFVAVFGTIALLMILQPDVGTLSIIAALSLIVFFVGGARKSHILVLVVSGIAALGILLLINPYQLERFKCLVDSEFSVRDRCYQTNQSLIAVGSGGWFGRGLGESRQKFMYLPEVSGDSIFAVISEEMGFVISAVLVLLYFFIFWRGYLIARDAPDVFGRLLAIGIASWIVVQALVNIGGMINLLPLTGVPLPLVSYGGSSLLAALSALGIMLNISRQTRVSHNS